MSVNTNVNGLRESNSKVIQSGFDAEGHPYHIEMDINGNTVHRKVNAFNPKTGQNEKHEDTFELNDPNNISIVPP